MGGVGVGGSGSEHKRELFKIDRKHGQRRIMSECTGHQTNTHKNLHTNTLTLAHNHRH